MMLDDLARPLGRDLKRPVKPPRRRGERIVAVAALVAILGGSLATALSKPPLRHADVFAEAEAKRMAALAAEAAAPAPLRPLPPTARVQSAPLVDPSLPTVTYPPGETGRAGQLVTVSDPSSRRQAPTLAHIPDDALIEPGRDGSLPIRGADGRRPFDVYSIQPSSSVGTRVAIVVGGLGISQTGTQAAIRKLPPSVTLGLSPAGNSLDRWMQDARRNGHELVLQVPMEPFGYPQTSPGEHTLTAEDAAAGSFSALDWSLGRVTNYVGVMNYMGARLTADPAALRPLASELARRGLMFLDDASSARSVARDVARETGTVFAAADVLLDASQDKASIEAELATLERVARANGSAIGVASAFDVSVAAIADWVKAAEARGVKVVPISALASDPENR
ncbi:divergent polysaccharide deacetylase family protein [Aureimonas sp. SA4125]|uniref:divergent polysaccharide deacetylase family protein n=1 Tax=Aureimonas sp. SA4125 TaxID=2826993 RepID=UPI001CC58E87|nr:divergent polysaccharide deacetylase family protein [Aureimonas sp. SA4125]